MPFGVSDLFFVEIRFFGIKQMKNPEQKRRTPLCISGFLRKMLRQYRRCRICRKFPGCFYATQFLSLAIYRSKGVSTVLPTA